MTISQRDLYLFDLRGYILLEDVLSAAELQLAHDVIDKNFTPPEKVTQANAYCDFLHWGGILSDLMIHPRVMEWADELCDALPRLDHAYFYYMRKDEPEPLGLHGGGTLVNHSEYFYFRNGKTHNGLIVVAWALNDSHQGDGGFCCVPGSHKSNYAFHEIYDCREYNDPVVQVPLKAGSVVIFTEALTHGTMGWKADHDRRALFYKYTPAAGVWSEWTPERWDAARRALPREWSIEQRNLAEQLFRPPCISRSAY